MKEKVGLLNKYNNKQGTGIKILLESEEVHTLVVLLVIARAFCIFGPTAFAQPKYASPMFASILYDGVISSLCYDLITLVISNLGVHGHFFLILVSS